MTVTSAETMVVQHQLGRITYVEPDNSTNAMDNAFFSFPNSKSITQETVPLHDIREDVFSESPGITLATHAFTAVKHHTALLANEGDSKTFLNPEMIEKVYIPEVEEIVKNISGARKVIVIRCAFRTKVPDTPAPSDPVNDSKTEKPNFSDIDFSKIDFTKPTYGMISKMQTGPARLAHIDYSALGTQSEIRNCRYDIRAEAEDIIASEDSAEADGKAYEGRRYAAYSIWRPLKPVTRDPLAMCDRNSMNEQDLLPGPIKRPGINGPYLSDMYMIGRKHVNQQRWYWIKDQQPDEVLIVQFYDSHASKEGRPVGAPHGSPELIGVENNDWRESFEVRCFAFW